MYGGFYFPCNRSWLVSLIFISFSFFTLYGFSKENISTFSKLETYDQIEKEIGQSDNLLMDSYSFLHSFIRKINAECNLSLTIKEAASLIKDNLDLYHFSDETRTSLLRLIESIQSFEDSLALNTAYIQLVPFEWMRKWVFSKSESDKVHFIVEPLYAQVSSGVPLDDLIVGLVEICTGVLIGLIPHPVTQGVGVGMVLDGSRRVFDATIEQSNINQSFSN